MKKSCLHKRKQPETSMSWIDIHCIDCAHSRDLNSIIISEMNENVFCQLDKRKSLGRWVLRVL